MDVFGISKLTIMKERILKGWNVQRGMFVLVGAIIIAQSVTEHIWLGMLPGIYFMIMGLFALGCAGGNCYVEPSKSKESSKEVEYEEVK